MSQTILPQSETKRLSTSQPLSKAEQRNWFISSILIVIITLYWLINESHPKQGALVFPTTGPAASWSAQKEVARFEAAKIHYRAVLANINANNADHSDIADPNKALEVQFHYYSPSGSNFIVSVIDVDPPVLKSVTRHASPLLNSTWYEDYSRSAIIAADQIRVSPRDVLRITLDDASTRREIHGNS